MTVSQSKTLSASLRDADNNQKLMLHASFSERGLSLSVEVLDAAYVAANRDAADRDTAQFIALACAEAAEAGVPAGRVNAA